MRESSASPRRHRVAFHLFWVSGMLLALGYGTLAGMYQLFPYALFASAAKGYQELRAGPGPTATTWYYRTVTPPYPPAIVDTGRAQPGTNLVTEILADALSVKVMAHDGRVLHRWTVDWFRIWPDAHHVPDRLLPRSLPGTHVDGATLLDNGDLVFNFEHLGLVRLDARGAVVWRLPYQTHHSVSRGADGNLWVCGQKERTAPLAGFPNLVPPFVEDTVLVVSPRGQIVAEWSVLELLRDNGRHGLLCLANIDNFSTAVSGDVTHLNHVESFPKDQTPAFFDGDDVLVSLRNINTVFVFSRRTKAIKFCCTGLFVRQHDPHFVDGRTISVFDNNNIGGESAQSRIVLVTAPEQAVTTYYTGSKDQPFFTPILGRHQWLPDGGLLVTDSCAGRAFELDRNREVVWSYVNYVGDGVVGAVEQVERIPADSILQHR